MSEDKRKRSPNWLPGEKDLLLSLVESHLDIIENKRTDGASMKTKLAQWKIIADQYNSRTSHYFHTAETLKAQWESMKKVARKNAKNAANIRKHIIQTGGKSPLPPIKEDPFLERILSLLSTSAVGLFNPYDSDSSVPAVQDQTAVPALQSKHCTDPLSPPKLKAEMPDEEDQISQTYVFCDTQNFETKDWSNTPKMLHAKKTKSSLRNAEKVEKLPRNNQSWASRRRLAHTNACSSLEQLHKKKIEALELQKQLTIEEINRMKVLHDLEMKIKKQILRQEIIKTNMLMVKQRKMLGNRKCNINN